MKGIIATWLQYTVDLWSDLYASKNVLPTLDFRGSVIGVVHIFIPLPYPISQLYPALYIYIFFSNWF